jgi:hypothetical protein
MYNDWRDPPRPFGLPELSFSFWNNTNETASTMAPFNSGYFDYYTAPSSPIEQTATISALLQRTVLETTTAMDICGSGWNCSYSISFIAPGYQCLDGTKDSNNPFNASWLLPDGDASYIVHATNGEYASVQMENLTSHGVPPSTPFPKHLGAFRMEPVIYFGYAQIIDPTISLPPNRTSDPVAWGKAFNHSIYACEHYETNYTILLNHTSAGLHSVVTQRQFLNKVVNTVYDPSTPANDGTLDNTTAIPEDNYVYPTDTARYRKVAAYHSIGLQLRNYLNGTILFEQTNAPQGNTEALKTKLIDPKTYLVLPNTLELLDSFYLDMILSLFSKPQFLVVAWAANGLSSGTGTTNDTALLYPCTKTRFLNRFEYSRRDLWIVYGLAIVLSGIGVVFGTLALSQNEFHERNIRFSSIVAATRARCMDELAWAKSNKYGLVPEELYDAKLGYGRVVNEVGPGDEAAIYGFAPTDRIVRRSVAGGLKGARTSVFSFQSWEDR